MLRRFHLAVLAVLALTAAVQAQTRRPTRYTPARPTTSPYLTLFNDAGGPVSTYFGVVRPQQRFAQVAQRQNQELRYQQQRINELSQGVTQEQLAPTGRGAWFGVGSQRSVYRDTSHYYFRWEDRRLPARP